MYIIFIMQSQAGDQPKPLNFTTETTLLTTNPETEQIQANQGKIIKGAISQKDSSKIQNMPSSQVPQFKVSSQIDNAILNGLDQNQRARYVFLLQSLSVSTHVGTSNEKNLSFNQDANHLNKSKVHNLPLSQDQNSKDIEREYGQISFEDQPNLISFEQKMKEKKQPDITSQIQQTNLRKISEQLDICAPKKFQIKNSNSLMNQCIQGNFQIQNHATQRQQQSNLEKMEIQIDNNVSLPFKRLQENPTEFKFVNDMKNQKESENQTNVNQNSLLKEQIIFKQSQSLINSGFGGRKDDNENEDISESKKHQFYSIQNNEMYTKPQDNLEKMEIQIDNVPLLVREKSRQNLIECQFVNKFSNPESNLVNELQHLKGNQIQKNEQEVEVGWQLSQIIMNPQLGGQELHNQKASDCGNLEFNGQVNEQVQGNINVEINGQINNLEQSLLGQKKQSKTRHIDNSYNESLNVECSANKSTIQLDLSDLKAQDGLDKSSSFYYNANQTIDQNINQEGSKQKGQFTNIILKQRSNLFLNNTQLEVQSPGSFSKQNNQSQKQRKKSLQKMEIQLDNVPLTVSNNFQQYPNELNFFNGPDNLKENEKQNYKADDESIYQLNQVIINSDFNRNEHANPNKQTSDSVNQGANQQINKQAKGYINNDQINRHVNRSQQTQHSLKKQSKTGRIESSYNESLNVECSVDKQNHPELEFSEMKANDDIDKISSSYYSNTNLCNAENMNQKRSKKSQRNEISQNIFSIQVNGSQRQRGESLEKMEIQIDNGPAQGKSQSKKSTGKKSARSQISQKDFNSQLEVIDFNVNRSNHNSQQHLSQLEQKKQLQSQSGTRKMDNSSINNSMNVQCSLPKNISNQLDLSDVKADCLNQSSGLYLSADQASGLNGNQAANKQKSSPSIFFKKSTNSNLFSNKNQKREQVVHNNSLIPNGLFSNPSNIFPSRPKIKEATTQNHKQANYSTRSNDSNHSQRSQSNQSNKSNSRKFNKFIDTVQPPPLSSLTLFKDSMSQPHVSRNSKNSRESRSVSTCKKSYQDLSQINMYKIDQSDWEQFDEKSIKRSKYVRPKSQAIQNQPRDESCQMIINSEIQNSNKKQNKSSAIQKMEIEKGPNQLYFDKSDPIPQSLEAEQVDKAQSFYQQGQNAILSKSELQLKPNEQKILKFTYNNVISLMVALKSQERLEEQQFHMTLQFCQNYKSRIYKTEFSNNQYTKMLQKYFTFTKIFPTPKNTIGQRLIRDGIFAISFIDYVVGSKINSLMSHTLHSKFDQEVGLQTNQQIFRQSFIRVQQFKKKQFQEYAKTRLKQIQESHARQIKEYANRQVIAKSKIVTNQIKPSVIKRTSFLDFSHVNPEVKLEETNKIPFNQKRLTMSKQHSINCLPNSIQAQKKDPIVTSIQQQKGLSNRLQNNSFIKIKSVLHTQELQPNNIKGSQQIDKNVILKNTSPLAKEKSPVIKPKKSKSKVKKSKVSLQKQAAQVNKEAFQTTQQSFDKSQKIKQKKIDPISENLQKPQKSSLQKKNGKPSYKKNSKKSKQKGLKDQKQIIQQAQAGKYNLRKSKNEKVQIQQQEGSLSACLQSNQKVIIQRESEQYSPQKQIQSQSHNKIKSKNKNKNKSKTKNKNQNKSKISLQKNGKNEKQNPVQSKFSEQQKIVQEINRLSGETNFAKKMNEKKANSKINEILEKKLPQKINSKDSIKPVPNAQTVPNRINIHFDTKNENIKVKDNSKRVTFQLPQGARESSGSSTFNIQQAKDSGKAKSKQIISKGPTRGTRGKSRNK